MMGGSARLATAARCAARALALSLILACGTARGEAVFTVAHVPIDAEAASSAEARELAIAAGQRDALEILLRRLTVEGASLPAPAEDSVAAMVAGFEIDRELVSTTRYRASLTVDFDPAEVRRLLRESGVAYAETVSKPVLVVAVQRDPGGILLWEDGNRWRRAWEERPPHGGLVPILLPLGDIIDLGAVDAKRALASDAEALGALGRLYGTSAVARSPASRAPLPSQSPPRPLKPHGGRRRRGIGRRPGSRSRSAGSLPETNLPSPLIGRTGESERALLERGTDRVVALLEDAWKAANLIRYDDHVLGDRSIASLGAVHPAFAALAMVAAVEIDSLSLREGRLTLRYHGSADQLRLALDQSDLALTPLADEWVLGPRAEKPEPEAPDAPAPGEAE